MDWNTVMRLTRVASSFPWEVLVRGSRRSESKHIVTGARVASEVTTDETVAYQNRELAKSLLVLERHLSQGCAIATARGKIACDCCSGRHPLELEKLSEEAQAMSAKPVYSQVIRFAREVEQKANVEAVRSGKYDTEYREMAREARALRKELTAPEMMRAEHLTRQVQTGEITKEEAVEAAEGAKKER